MRTVVIIDEQVEMTGKDWDIYRPSPQIRWVCPCGFQETDVAYLAARIDLLCPNCGTPLSQFSRLRSEKTGELDPSNPTVAPTIERKDRRNDVPSRRSGNS